MHEKPFHRPPAALVRRKWRRLCFLVSLGLVLALPRFVMASEAIPAPARPHEITAGAATSFFIGHRDITNTAWMLDVAYHYRPQKNVVLQSFRFTSGMRMGRKPDDKGGVFDVYLRGDMIANVGPWTPTLGPEIGFSTLGSRFFRYPAPFPDDLTILNEKKLSPFYMALVVNPIRFCFSRVTVSALELSLGAPMNGIGSVVRFQLGVLHVGGTL